MNKTGYGFVFRSLLALFYTLPLAPVTAQEIMCPDSIVVDSKRRLRQRVGKYTGQLAPSVDVG